MKGIQIVTWMIVVYSLLLLTACDTVSDSTIVGGDRNITDGDEAADGDGSTDNEDASPTCGDATCDSGESCITCADCECNCGDGVCSFGEFCAICPQDCDCETLAATPPMGWNSWNRFHCDINEEMIRGVADAMVDSGMLAAGYNYLNLDDCWQIARDENGRIVADPENFPSGIPVLADYVHSKGLKFGLYTCAGTMTCQERPGSYEHEQIDAETYAEWGVDYIKVDWCFTDGMDPHTRYTAMHDALESVDYPIVHSICNWGIKEPHVWGSEIGHLWRTSGDIADWYPSMVSNLLKVKPLSAYAGPGHWNDPDMLEIGNGGMANNEYRVHMSLWTVLSAPLIAGNDLREMDEQTKAFLLNSDAIAVDQDPWGLAAVEVEPNVYSRPLAKAGLRAVVLYNPEGEEKTIGIGWTELGLAGTAADVRDIWTGEELGSFETGYDAKIAPYDAAMLLVRGTEFVPAGDLWLSDVPAMHMVNSLGPVEKDRSVGTEESKDGDPISIAGTAYEKGFGTGGAAILVYHLGGNCQRFTATIGLDDSAGQEGSVEFEVWVDNEKKFESGIMTPSSSAQELDVELDGIHFLKLVVTAAGDTAEGDLADWANAKLTCN